MPPAISKAYSRHIEAACDRLRTRDRALAELLESIAYDTLQRALVEFNTDPSVMPWTEIITGDIPAMWFRDAVLQVEPLWAVAGQCSQVDMILEGLVLTLSKFLSLAPYANAVQVTVDPPNRERLKALGIPEEWMNGATPHKTDQLPPSIQYDQVWEQKYELDSVGWYLHLVRRFLQARIPSSRCRRRQMSGLGLASYKLWDHLDDGLEEGLVAAVELLQRETSPADGSLYTFHRPGGTPLDAVVESDAPYRFGDFDCSLAWSAFRPSDDRSLLPFPIGANALVARELRLLADIILTCVTPDQARCARLVWNRNSPETILRKSNNELPVLGHHLNHLAGRLTRGVVAVAARATRHHGSALPYETDGFGQDLHTDDPNVPGLLSLDWLGTPNITSLDRSHLIKKGLWPWKGNQDPWTSLLPATRSRVLSPDNPRFIPLPHTAVPGGLGSEHTPAGMIWPMSLAVAALGESEPQRRLDWTRALADLCPDGQVHESVDPNEPTRFTRDWFSMGNALGTLALVAASQSREKPTTDRL